MGEPRLGARRQQAHSLALREHLCDGGFDDSGGAHAIQTPSTSASSTMSSNRRSSPAISNDGGSRGAMGGAQDRLRRNKARNARAQAYAH